jgi:hypothetical protein
MSLFFRPDEIGRKSAKIKSAPISDFVPHNHAGLRVKSYKSATACRFRVYRTTKPKNEIGKSYPYGGEKSCRFHPSRGDGAATGRVAQTATCDNGLA